MNKRIAIFLPLFVIITLACNLATSTNPNANSPDNPDVNPPAQPGINPTKPAQAKKPTATPLASQPVSISEGLASLNSYRMTFSITSKGPDPSVSSTTMVETRRSQKQDARYTHISSSSVKKGVDKPTTSDSEIYRIATDQCSKSNDKWSWSSMTPNEAEMMDVIMNMFSINPVIDKPTFVANETVNGIPSRHYSFKAAGLGAKSGAEVTANQGDYWLAVDGQYIVKYSLVLESVADPETNIMHMETTIEMKDINQPVDIAFPQACRDAAAATPEP